MHRLDLNGQTKSCATTRAYTWLCSVRRRVFQCSCRRHRAAKHARPRHDHSGRCYQPSGHHLEHNSSHRVTTGYLPRRSSPTPLARRTNHRHASISTSSCILQNQTAKTVCIIVWTSNIARLAYRHSVTSCKHHQECVVPNVDISLQSG